MRLVVGLGNPGDEYARTRHNLGWRVADEFARRHGAAFRAVSPRCAVAEGRLPAGRVVLLKPLTFMNRSGAALLEWAARAGVTLRGRAEAPGLAPIVVCDDIALPLGALRIRARGSAGGHRGLVSIIEALGGEEFARIRLGCAPAASAVPAAAWVDFVLSPLSDEESAAADELVAYAADALEALLQEGAAAAAGRFNRRPAPPAGSAAGA